MPFLSPFSRLFGRAAPAKADTFVLPKTAFDTSLEDRSPGPSRRGSFAPLPGPPTPSNPASPNAANSYPPLSHTFHRLRNALAETFPELLETLNRPAAMAHIIAAEKEIGSPFPPAVRDSFLVADGQDLDTSNAGGMFYGLYLLPLEEVMREWAFWRQAEADPSTGTNPAVLATMASVPPQWVKSEYACRGWIPLVSDRSGNYVGVDLDPGPGGAWGQAIIFGRDFDRKAVLWGGEGEGGWGKWLATFVDEVESGEGWEADKTSDDEEELGYSSYNGGDVYGIRGGGLRLAGEYRGWGVLEAWWDKSVKKWEGLGLGMDVAAIERGLDEARRLTGNDKGKARAEDRSSVDLAGIRTDQRTAELEIPTLSSPQRSSALPTDHDSLLPQSASSDVSSNIPRILHPAHSPTHSLSPISTDHPASPIPPISPVSPTSPMSPVSPVSPVSPTQRTITPRGSATDHHPLKPDSELLSPPDRQSAAGRRRVSRRPPPPAPSILDLPTRADVKAAEAIAAAEASGRSGGWILNLDASAGAAQRRVMRSHHISPSLDAEMVDIDLEGGRQEPYGTPPMSAEDLRQQDEADRMAMAGIEHRRGANSPVLLAMSRTPSPLARSTMERSASQLSQTSSNGDIVSRSRRGTGATLSPTSTGTPPYSPSSANIPTSMSSGAIRRPPPISTFADQRSRSPTPGARRRSSTATPTQSTGTTPLRDREVSVLSAGSQEGLLDQQRANSGGSSAGGINESSPLTDTPLTGSPGRMASALPPASAKVNDLADGLEEIAL